MGLVNRVTDALNVAGIEAFSLAMPTMSQRWTKTVDPVADDNRLSLNLLGLADESWLAPLAGTLRLVSDQSLSEDSEDLRRLLVTLTRPDGSHVQGPGLLLTVYPQAYLRLSRLYMQVLEQEPAAGSNPLLERARQRGLAVRPVPRYFFYHGELTAGDKPGDIRPGEEIGREGDLTIYDKNGWPIDPRAVAAAFQAILTAHPVLEIGTGGSPQLGDITGSPAAVRLWLSTRLGQPYDGANLTGLSPAPPQASGLFTLNEAAGGGFGAINVAAASDSFSAEQRRLMLIGPPTSGKFGDNFSPPALPASVSLTRDFFHVHVVQLEKYLLGTSTYPDNPDADEKLEQRPDIRLNEPLNLLVDGNDVLGAAGATLPAGAAESLSVAQMIDGDFPAPTEIGQNAHWPDFPANGVGTDDSPLPVNLRDGFAPTATLFDNGDPEKANLDVVLTLNGLPEGVSVRVYNRKFTADASVSRGDGAGGIVPPGGTISLLLKDPLSIRKLGEPESLFEIPPGSHLHCDVIVVRRSQNRVARIYGNVHAPIVLDPATTTDPTSTESNRFGSAARQGVSHAGVLGLGAERPLLPVDALDTILTLGSEGTPRDAPRFPTMARRDLIVAGLSGTSWRGVIAGGRLAPEMLSAGLRLGAPGGLGGRETQIAGLATQNGRLAYDLARMAFRRTSNSISRLIDLADTDWEEPAALTPGGTNAGTFAGAVLQTISPFCETPEFGLLEGLFTANDLPDTFAEMVKFVKDLLADQIPGSTPRRQDIVNAINSRLDSLLADIQLTPENGERLLNELKRELVSSGHGRRDAQWSLVSALKNARRFIYIESPGFAATQKDYAVAGEPEPDDKYFVDLIKIIADQLKTTPGLHVIICTPKVPDYGPGYEMMAAHEAFDRKEIIMNLPEKRVVSFHPIGFPGRPGRLESTVVIVDDLWALVGSSSIRRRGLTFDGGSDVVFADVDLLDGRSQSIAAFRRRLLANHLGLQTSDENDFGTMPDPDFVRLADGIEAFYLIREKLIAGGLGKIDRLFTAPEPELELSIDLTNPDGKEFDLAEALLLALSAP